MNPKNVFALNSSSFGGGIISSSGNYIIEGSKKTGFIIEPVEKDTSTSNITNDFKLTSADDGIVVPISSSAINSVDNFLNGDNELKASGAIYEITQEIVDANESLPLAGNFSLIGDNVDGWIFIKVNITNSNNIELNGSPISLTNTQKGAFDSLSLSSSSSFTLETIPLMQVLPMQIYQLLD